jgi:hypothetical protein
MPDREMSMVERVARALSVADGMHPDACSNDEDETPAWTLYVGSAKAAIDAITKGSEAFGSFCYDRQEDGVASWAIDTWTGNCFEAFFDAALKEHEEQK